MASGTGTIAGVILAGGRGQRFAGADKAFLTLGGLPLIANAIERVRPQVAALAINANGDASRFAAFGLPVLPDTVPGFAGPLAGMLAGLEWGKRLGAARVAMVAVDTPFFPLDLVRRLAAAAHGPEISVAVSGGKRHQIFALVPVTLADDLAAFIRGGASLKVADWQARHAVVEVPFAPAESAGIDPFFNINTGPDLAAAEKAAPVRPLRERREK